MSTRHSDWVWAHSQSTGAARLVLLSLAAMANDEDICWCKQITIEERAKCSERAVRDAIKHLRDDLKELQVAPGHGPGAASTYRICMTAAESAGITESEKRQDLPLLPHKAAKSAAIEAPNTGRFFQENRQIIPAIPADSAPQSTTELTTDPKALKTTRARAEESSSTSAEPEIDDDDDLPLPSVPLGLWSKKLYSPQQLRSAARNLGIEHGLDHDWAGYGAWLKSAKPGDLVALLGWLIHYGDLPVAAQRRIESLTAILRTHLKRDERAALNSQQMGYLERYIARSCYSDNLDTYVDELVEETVKRHGGGAWVPADASLFPYGGH